MQQMYIMDNNSILSSADFFAENFYQDINTDQDLIINNQSKTYKNKEICITLNQDHRFQKYETILCQKFPEIAEIPSNNKIQYIVDRVFKNGLRISTFVRNLSFKTQNDKESPTLAIRPEILPYSYLAEILPKGYSLLFKGHLFGRSFIVDAVFDTPDTEQLPFEASCEFVPKDSPDLVRGGNFLIDVLHQTESLTKHTEERLATWEQYLNWKEELAKQQIVGVKYYRCDIDVKHKRLLFWLVCPDMQYFHKIKKWLHRDMQVFENQYSSNKWIFQLDTSDNAKIHYKTVELGRFQGIVTQFSLDLKKITAEQNKKNTTKQTKNKRNIKENTEISAQNNGKTEEISEITLFDHFKKPYIVEVAYDLNQNDKEEMDMMDFPQPYDMEMYLRERVLPQYFSNGFLALSAVGEFSLIRRFRNAINNLKNSNISYSPNLAVWLFNIQQARLPDASRNVVISTWLNEDIAKNENQRTAIEKMIAAPDVFLLQGPPGTGKTTVIAEAIYQFIQQGYRVLVASQSNDAVDNALERLSVSPMIRAVRLGQRSRKKRDKIPNIYSLENTLTTYYQTVSNHVRKKWILPWSVMEERKRMCEKDLYDIRQYSETIKQLNLNYTDIDGELKIIQRREKNLEKKINNVNEQNERIRYEKHQYAILMNVFKTKENIPFSLSEKQLIQVFNDNCFLQFIYSSQRAGVYFISQSLFQNHFVNHETDALREFISRLNILHGLIEKLQQETSQSKKDQASMDLLQFQAEKLKNQMADAFAEGDMESANALRDQLNQIKEQINTMKNNGYAIDISVSEKEILSTELYQQISSEENKNILMMLYQNGENVLNELIKNLSDYMDSLSLSDTQQLIDEQKQLHDKRIILTEKQETISKQIEEQNTMIKNMMHKYHVVSESYSALLTAIESKQKEYTAKISKTAHIRKPWEEIMKQFCEKIESEDSMSNEIRYFQPVFLESCNVVGISCTDNMRELSEYHLDDFDVVIIDEVSKATPPELLIPLMKARKAVIVGDHRQLPPMFNEHENSYDELFEDIENMPEEIQELMTKENFKKFKTMVTSALFKEYFEKANEQIKHSLITQYRMHSDIMDVINRFYELRLKSGLSREKEEEIKSHGMIIDGIDHSSFIVPENHAYWIDSSVLPYSKRPLYDSRGNPKTANSGGTSIYNVFEKWIVIELLKKLADAWREEFNQTQKKKSVGIISFYQAQVNRIRDAFKKERQTFDFSPLDIEINTVDRFQGKEKNIVIVSLVRNNANARASKHVVAFERINVAFSRAQELLLIVGSQHMYEKQRVTLPNMDQEGTVTSSVYRNIIDELNRKGTFKGSEKLISKEMETLILKDYEGGDS